MANRYWVGGNGTWDGTTTTNWSASSGGAGGASVPTAADSVFFDQATTYSVTLSGGAINCLDLTVSAGTVTFTGSGTPAISGSFSLIAGTTWSSSGAITFNATTTGKTVTTNGTSLSAAITFNGVGGAWTLGSALTTSGAITVTNGTFNTGNYAVTATFLTSSTSNVRSINLGSSTVTLTAGSGIVFSTNTNLTFNAGTSNIICQAASTSIAGGGAGGTSTGVTFYNVSFTSTTAGTHVINATNTFNNIAVAAPSSAGVTSVSLAGSQTINGALTTTGTAGNRRVWFQSATYGLQYTLTVNSAASLTDADFRDIIVQGTAAPISGTRIGDLRGCSGITFSAPKTVYWNLAAGGNWSANAWATSAGGTVSTDNFPLAQDTATFVNTGLNTAATVTMDTAIPYIGTIDMSARTTTMGLVGATYTMYGDWKTGSGVTYSGAFVLTFSGRNTQTFTSSGKSFSYPITVDSYGGTVQLADALNIVGNAFTVTNGTFTTNGYAVTAGTLSSNNSNVRAINLGASTVTLSTGVTFTTATNLTLNAGTSTINITAASGGNFALNNLNYYNLVFSGTSGTATPRTISGNATIVNLTIAAMINGSRTNTVENDLVITGTLTFTDTSPTNRLLLCSLTTGTDVNISVNAVSGLSDIDFRDVNIIGNAAPISGTRLGDCGNNVGITFPAPKTVYWNLAGAQSVTANGWAATSGGTPSTTNFPLAQDTAVFNDAGSAGTVSITYVYQFGNIDMTARTSAMTFQFNGTTQSNFYGDLLFGTGVTTSGSVALIFRGYSKTQTIRCNGVSISPPITINSATTTVQLADAFSMGATSTLTLTLGTFDAVSYNVTVGLFTASAGTLKMGSGTWTLSGTGTVWNGGVTNFFKGTANIVLSDTSTTARSFAGQGLSYNKLTIGGTTGASTFTITGANQFTELASTKTVAHTIVLPGSTTTIGKWSVSGTVGNIVTVTSAASTLSIVGAAVSGVDYLAMGTTALSATSPAEFFAGANSTGSGSGIILTAAPTPRTLYWRGGTGTWDASTTTNWSTSSGGAGGAAVPTSLDAVIFNTLSNTTAYTVTCTATQLRCASLTIGAPLTGALTFAGTAPLALAGNLSIAASGVTRTWSGALTLSGAGSYTFTTNGVALSSTTTVNGIGSTWTLGSAATISAQILITNGTFDTASYALNVSSLSSSNSNNRTINLNASTVTTTLSNSLSITNTPGLVFNSGTSTLNLSSVSGTFTSSGLTWYNVNFTTTNLSGASITGPNTFNNLSYTGRTSTGISTISLSDNQIINGTLTLSAGTDATMRTFVQSDTIGTPRTLTCNAVASLTDIDFRDITFAGNCVSGGNLTGTRLGDCKGNTGITFSAGKTVYWNSGGGGNWSGIAWASSSGGGGVAVNNFPLAQDTAVFQNVNLNSGSTVTVNASYNIGTIDMSARTSNTMTLTTSTSTPTIYGNWINGTGTTIGGTAGIIFAGRGSQTITSAGAAFTQAFVVNTPGGSVTLQDSFVGSGASYNLTSGTFNANNYNVTINNAGGLFTFNNLNIKTLAIGSGTWSFPSTSGTFWNGSPTNTTITGTGTINASSASAKTFAGFSTSYPNITLNQGGAGALTISGNNTFANITNTNTTATSIALGSTIQTVGNFTASGTAGNLLTITGNSAGAPATLIFSGSGTVSENYIVPTFVRAYPLTSTWYAGANSTNGGSLGYIFSAAPGPTFNSQNFFLLF
jgi:fibronectin-binding autotransporter adhesin